MITINHLLEILIAVRSRKRRMIVALILQIEINAIPTRWKIRAVEFGLSGSIVTRAAPAVAPSAREIDGCVSAVTPFLAAAVAACCGEAGRGENSDEGGELHGVVGLNVGCVEGLMVFLVVCLSHLRGPTAYL